MKPIIYTFPTVKPIDKETIKTIASICKYIFTIEEHNVIGGFGSAVSEVVSEITGNKASVLRVGLNDEYSIKVGAQKYLREQYKLDGKSIANIIIQNVEG